MSRKNNEKFQEKNPLETACTKQRSTCLKFCYMEKQNYKSYFKMRGKNMIPVCVEIIKAEAIEQIGWLHASIFLCYLICIALPATAACQPGFLLCGLFQSFATDSAYTAGCVSSSSRTGVFGGTGLVRTQLIYRYMLVSVLYNWFGVLFGFPKAVVRCKCCQ